MPHPSCLAGRRPLLAQSETSLGPDPAEHKHSYKTPVIERTASVLKLFNSVAQCYFRVTGSST